MKTKNSSGFAVAVTVSIAVASLTITTCCVAALGANSTSPAAKSKDKKKAKDGWNSDLSKMMDDIGSEMPGTPASPAGLPPDAVVPNSDNGTTSTLPVAPPDLPTEPQAKISNTGTTDSYFSEIEAAGLTRWNKTRMPIKVFIESQSKVPGFRAEFVDILKQAFADWAQPLTNQISISYVPTTENAQVLCTWTDRTADMMNPKEGGNTIIIPDSAGIVRAEMKLLTIPAPGAGSISNNYMRRVCLHEAGHAIGLTGHSTESGDIMFGTVFPKDQPVNLSDRDKNTIRTLYTAPESVITSHRLDATSAQIEPSTNPRAMALLLNNEGAKAIQAGKMDVAVKKLEEALKLDPTNQLVKTNLGSVYANFGSLAGMTMNMPVAAQFFKKAIPLLEGGNNKTALTQVLTNYINVLQVTNDQAELKKMQAKLTQATKIR